MPIDPQWERRLLDMDAGPERVRYWRNMLRDDACKICDAPISSAELCDECAKGNDPFKNADNCGADLKR